MLNPFEHGRLAALDAFGLSKTAYWADPEIHPPPSWGQKVMSKLKKPLTARNGAIVGTLAGGALLFGGHHPQTEAVPSAPLAPYYL